MNQGKSENEKRKKIYKNRLRGKFYKSIHFRENVHFIKSFLLFYNTYKYRIIFRVFFNVYLYQFRGKGIFMENQPISIQKSVNFGGKNRFKNL